MPSPRPTFNSASGEWSCKPSFVPAGGRWRSFIWEGCYQPPLAAYPRAIERATLRSPIGPCSEWGLASRRVPPTLVSSYLTISPLPVPETGHRRCSFCATFRGSPRLAFRQHCALWSSDFPHRLQEPARPPDPLSNCIIPDGPSRVNERASARPAVRP